MKKIFIFFILFFSSNIFGHNFNDYHWYSFKYLNRHLDALQPFDIIVLNKGKEITQQFGHLFIVNKDKKLVEIKGMEDYYSDNPIYTFSHITNRKISIFRYKKMTEKLMNELEKILPEYYNKKYTIFVNNDPKNVYTYCSNFVYNLFVEASENLKIEKIELVRNKYPILPFDFFYSKDLENIYLGEEK